MPEPHEVFAAEQAALYGQYKATEPIFIGGARAFNVGDAVPASHVDREIVRKDQVERVSNKAQAAATVKES